MTKVSQIQNIIFNMGIAQIQYCTDTMSNNSKIKLLLEKVLFTGVVNDKEKGMLEDIFSRVSPSDVSSNTLRLISNIKKTHHIT
jgi:hypothetical protein